MYLYAKCSLISVCLFVMSGKMDVNFLSVYSANVVGFSALKLFFILYNFHTITFVVFVIFNMTSC